MQAAPVENMQVLNLQNSAGCNCFASQLLLPCRHVAAQTFTMMLAGYETTANTLAFSVYLLGKYPETQQRLLQEVDQHPSRPGYDSLHQFPYAAAIINEALRLYPPATQLSRVASEDVQVCTSICHVDCDLLIATAHCSATDTFMPAHTARWVCKVGVAAVMHNACCICRAQLWQMPCALCKASWCCSSTVQLLQCCLKTRNMT